MVEYIESFWLWLQDQLPRREFHAPPEWRQILDKGLPYFAFLDSERQDKLLRLTARFVEETRFEGAHGRSVETEKQVMIGAQACLLLLGWEPGPLFPTLRTIILYPSLYRADETRRQPEGTEIRERQTRSGESWAHGTVLLSWRDVRSGARDPHDAYNVVLHEFAHQLDEETGETNGAPALENAAAYEEWQRVWSPEFDRLTAALDRGQPPPLLEEYAGQNPAEFFAVAIEWFFERPHSLYETAPELYQQLQRFLKQDPRRYFTAPA